MSKITKEKLDKCCRHKSELDLLIKDKKILCRMVMLQKELFKKVSVNNYTFVKNFLSENKDFKIVKQEIYDCLNLVAVNYFPEFKKRASLEQIHKTFVRLSKDKNLVKNFLTV